MKRFASLFACVLVLAVIAESAVNQRRLAQFRALLHNDTYVRAAIRCINDETTTCDNNMKKIKANLQRGNRMSQCAPDICDEDERAFAPEAEAHIKQRFPDEYAVIAKKYNIKE